MTERIMWIVTEHGGYTGHVGTLEPWLFQLWHCETCSGEWSLQSVLSGQHLSDHFSSDDIGELKQRAEDMLADFTAALGASFPPIDARWNDLREYLKTCISDLEQDIEGKPRDAQRFPRGQAAAFAHVLQHMLELEGKR